MSPLPDRFWAKVDITPGCWLWTGAKSRGHGTIWWQGRQQYAHRVAYQELVGPIAGGQVVDHKCRTRACVNPWHLQSVTVALNNQNQPGANSGSRSGVRGVSWHKGAKKWRATATVNGKQHHGGYHATVDEAEAAAVALRLQLMTNSLMDKEAA